MFTYLSPYPAVTVCHIWFLTDVYTYVAMVVFVGQRQSPNKHLNMWRVQIHLLYSNTEIISLPLEWPSQSTALSSTFHKR